MNICGFENFGYYRDLLTPLASRYFCRGSKVVT